jgi:hypothetical protein
MQEVTNNNSIQGTVQIATNTIYSTLKKRRNQEAFTRKISNQPVSQQYQCQQPNRGRFFRKSPSPARHSRVHQVNN